jgi:hypothetical protein
VSLHLMKLAVGIDDVEHLRRIRAQRTAERGGSWVFTRNRPRRVAELLDGGSIYWVIRGQKSEYVSVLSDFAAGMTGMAGDIA